VSGYAFPRNTPFWERVQRGTADACWLWLGSRHPQGHGQVRVNGTVIYAHRHAYVLAHGHIPAGLIVRHRCDNPPCCNPAHLELGTVADNSRDAVERRQHWAPRGATHPRAKFSDALIESARCMRAGGLSNLEVAEQTGISPSYVSRITRKEGRA
jgi:hypothetical protein